MPGEQLSPNFSVRASSGFSSDMYGSHMLLTTSLHSRHTGWLRHDERQRMRCVLDCLGSSWTQHAGAYLKYLVWRVSGCHCQDLMTAFMQAFKNVYALTALEDCNIEHANLVWQRHKHNLVHPDSMPQLMPV